MSAYESELAWSNRIRIERIESRYDLVCRTATIPILSVPEVDILFWGYAVDGQSNAGEPVQILTQWCEFRKQAAEYDWRSDAWYTDTYPEAFTMPDPFDTSVYDDLMIRIREWTVLECLKVVRIFEDFRDVHFRVLNILPKVIHKLLYQAPDVA